MPKRRNSHDPYTMTLLHCDGADGSQTITDATGRHTFVAVNNAQIDTEFTVANLGQSLRSDWNGGSSPDYVWEDATSADWNFGTGDFTVEFRLRVKGHETYLQGIISAWEDINNYWKISRENDGSGKTLNFYGSTGGVDFSYYAETTTIDLNTFYHCSIVRTAGTILMFIDGAAQTLHEVTALGAGTAVGTSNCKLWIMVSYTGGEGGNLDGNVDEIRVSKGIARNTTAFTVPVTPYNR